jgi:hypothetical protein
MQSRSLNIIVLLVLCLFMHASVAAQQLKAKATVDKTTILIGEPIKLQLEATVPLGTSFTWSGTDSIAHFEIVERRQPDSTRDMNASIYRQEIIITSFDSGSWKIPAFALQAGTQRSRTDTFSINVTYSPDTASTYHDIKDILTVEEPGNPYIPWIIAAATLLAVIGLYFLLRKKKPAVKAPAQPVSKLTPYEEAMEGLNALRKEQPADMKQYYTRLNDIFRWYVYRKLGFSSLEKTNEELIMQLRQARLSNDEYTSLAQALRMADFVKFAKYVPSESDREQAFQTIKTSIGKLDASASPAT